MAVFRIDKTKDYTVMANHHLRNKALSLKAKGLLSLMLSLPDDWDYTTRGLAMICKDGVDSICSTVRELESAGYIQRRRIRDGHGRLAEIEYTILEHPAEPEISLKRENPVLENPVLENPEQVEPEQVEPEQEKPEQEKPEQEKPVALLNTKKSKTEKSNTVRSNTQSFLPSEAPAADGQTDGQMLRAEIRDQIEYDYLISPANRAQVDELVEIMVEVAMNRSKTVKIGRDAEYPASYVQDRFRKLTGEHIRKVLEGIGENTTRVYNTRAYLLAALFNAVSTMDNHYAMLVNHDFYGDSP